MLLTNPCGDLPAEFNLRLYKGKHDGKQIMTAKVCRTSPKVRFPPLPESYLSAAGGVGSSSQFKPPNYLLTSRFFRQLAIDLKGITAPPPKKGYAFSVVHLMW